MINRIGWRIKGALLGLICLALAGAMLCYLFGMPWEDLLAGALTVVGGLVFFSLVIGGIMLLIVSITGDTW